MSITLCLSLSLALSLSLSAPLRPLPLSLLLAPCFWHPSTRGWAFLVHAPVASGTAVGHCGATLARPRV